MITNLITLCSDRLKENMNAYQIHNETKYFSQSKVYFTHMYCKRLQIPTQQNANYIFEISDWNAQYKVYYMTMIYKNKIPDKRYFQ